MALGEALAIGAENRGQMGELGNRPAEGFIDGDLLGGVGDVVVAANDVGDAHQGVVNGDDVVVDRDAAAFDFGNTCSAAGGAADQDRIADRVGGELDRAADDVVKAEGVVFNAEANGVGLAVGEILVHGARRERAAAAGVDMRLVLGHGQEALGLQFIRSAETAVGLAFREQPFGVLGVDGQAFGLAIGAEVAGFGLARR